MDLIVIISLKEPPWQLSGKESACQCKGCRFDPWVGEIPWRRKWQPTPVVFSEKFHGQKKLAGYSLWGCKELDMTEQLSMHTHIMPSKAPPLGLCTRCFMWKSLLEAHS